MPSMLPALRRRAGIEVKSISGGLDVPAAFAHYYADLAAYNVHHRARHWPVERAVVEGYERVIWVFKSVSSIASDHSRLDFCMRQGGEDVDDHPLMRVLNKRANPLEIGSVFRKRLSAQISLSKKGAIVEVTKSNGGTIKRVDLLPPDRTEPIPSSDGGIDHWRLTRRNGSIRNIEPDKVRWFREPHPTDPYSGMTPLEAAGMSVELDHMARLYNLTWMQNDGRPAGVLAVRKTDGSGGDISASHMDRIESRFAKGAHEAGKLSVIAGELSYVDLSSGTPKDGQYPQLARNSKIEVLSAFGVPESVLGYSADRTFDNADNELYVYWTRTMANHNDIIVSGFDEDSEDDLEGYLDTSDIEVLERHEKSKREEARTEVAAGLRSIISYATMAGYADEIDDTPQTRALYVPQGKTPLPARKADYVALGLPDPDAPPVEPGQAGDAGGGSDAGGPAALPGAPAELAGPSEQTPPAAPGAPADQGAIDDGLDMAAFAGKARPEPRRRTWAVQIKAAQDAVDGDGDWVDSEPDPAMQAALEAQLAAALNALGERWIERTVARIGSPKQRKGTRHWTPEYEHDTRLGTKALDAAKAVDEQTWESEAEQAVSPIVTAAVVAVSAGMLADLGLTATTAPALRQTARQAVEETIEAVTRFIASSAGRMARSMIAAANDADQAGEDLPGILDAVRGRGAALRSWASGLATQAATATVNGAREDTATVVVTEPQDPPPAAEAGEQDVSTFSEVQRIWWSRRDTKVRHSHAPGTGADGQVRELHEPFIVGDSLVRFPGDPKAPLSETAGCRCHLRYRFKRSGRWTRKPMAADALARGA